MDLEYEKKIYDMFIVNIFLKALYFKKFSTEFSINY